MNTLASRWPLPALLAWAAGWVVFRTLGALGAPESIAFGCATTVGVLAAAVGGTTPWRRAFIASGFPVSLLASGVATGALALGWLAAALLLLLLYPLRSWRDAPLFPTPRGALDGLSRHVCVPADARMVDAGCGLGAGLIALRRSFPAARLEGLEWSWPLVVASRWRCRDAFVRRADIWQADWSGQDLVYLFQRPESMTQAVDKARRELRSGAWLVSLEFPAPGLKPDAQLEVVAGKPVWAYRAPFKSSAETAPG